MNHEIAGSKFQIIVFVLLAAFCFMVQSAQDTANNALENARTELQNAHEYYAKGDIEAARRNLSTAHKSLELAAAEIKSDRAKEETARLADEIRDLDEKVEHDSRLDQSTLSALWHKVTAIIARETDESIHGYRELSAAEATLRPLLDAKMHLYLAEHDLFFSGDVGKAQKELEKTLKFLTEASEKSDGGIKESVNKLVASVRRLQSQSRDGSWVINDIERGLNDAASSLAEAAKNASPPVRVRLESIRSDILKLGEDIDRTNLRVDYDAARAALSRIVNSL